MLPYPGQWKEGRKTMPQVLSYFFCGEFSFFFSFDFDMMRRRIGGAEERRESTRRESGRSG